MKKDECERGIRALCHQWRTDAGLDDTPTESLSFTQFMNWLQNNHPSYVRFRTTTSVRFDVEMWFDQEFGLLWRR